jgi:hypothetical protein
VTSILDQTGRAARGDVVRCDGPGCRGEAAPPLRRPWITVTAYARLGQLPDVYDYCTPMCYTAELYARLAA